jgi:hypothetical protein
MTAGHKNLYSDVILQNVILQNVILQNVIIPNASPSNVNTPSMNYGYKIKYSFKIEILTFYHKFY